MDVKSHRGRSMVTPGEHLTATWTSGSRGDVGTHTNLNKTSLEEGCDLGRDWLFSWLTVLFLKINFF